MTLGRNELAARFAVALAAGDWACPNDMNSPPGEVVRLALEYADALLLALTPTAAPAAKGEAHDEARRDGAAHALAFVREFYPPCEEPADLSAREIATNAADAYSLPPVAPKSEAAKYAPKVGDVVRFVVYGATNGDGVVVAIQREGVASIRLFGESVHALTWGRYFKDLAYLRPATPAERKAAGIVEPSPEATRPTHVKYVGVLSSDKTLAREVLSWDAKGQPRVKYLSGAEVTLFAGEWEPATPPAPVEPAKGGTVENMAAHLAWCAWCGTDDRSELPYDAFRAGYRTALAARGGS